MDSDSPDVSTDLDVSPDAPWSPRRSSDTYFVEAWSDGYFFVNDAGHVATRPIRETDTEVDVFDVVRELGKRGIAFPALIRFQDLLKSRVDHLNGAFQSAIAESGYENTYEGVYPVKVNQLREVVEEILDAGAPYRHGLECGSKSELIATLPYLADRDVLLLCNGAKDRDMMRLMLAGQRLGKRVLPVLERSEELDLALEEAGAAEVTVDVGVRVRLTTRGAGLWSESGGENSKFGLSLSELVDLVEQLRADGLPLRIKLLHFHLGSQIADLDTLREAVEEAARVCAWMLEKKVGIEYFDVGGGLGVAYEAGNPEALGTINYELDDYARTVVSACKRIFDESGVPHPILVSESGRAVTAHHSMLVVEAVGRRRKDVATTDRSHDDKHPLLDALRDLSGRLDDEGAETPGHTIEVLDRIYKEAHALKVRVTDLFRAGEVGVETKARFDRAFWNLCIAIDRRLQDHDRGPGAAESTRGGDAAQSGRTSASAEADGMRDVDRLPETLRSLEYQLVDHYQCNFSIFRSMVDYWAIQQRFPIMPLHRLDERPTRRGVLVDLTCDSDGKVDRFVSAHGDKRHLELHELRPDEPYFLGLFLMGAYQDIMGDMHNLFGRVTEVHVYADETEPDNFYLDEILPGATVEEQLELVQYHANDLERRMGDLIRTAVSAGRLRPREGVLLLNQYRSVFRDMTYLKTAEAD
ncbi:MAG: biosynthetic arginine decarboxylase [Rhodothermales bacterium]